MLAANKITGYQKKNNQQKHHVDHRRDVEAKSRTLSTDGWWSH
jgi:hypothetical protein